MPVLSGHGVAAAVVGRERIADFIGKNRSGLVDAILTGKHSGVPKPNRFGEAPERLRERVGNWVDLLGKFFAGGEGMRELVVGQTTYEYAAPDRSQSENLANLGVAVAALRAEILGEVDRLLPEIVLVLAAALDELLLGLTQPTDAYVDTLLIGDCLMMEVGGLAAEKAARAGVGFNPSPINVRSVEQLAQIIEKRPYKAIFFSPFSHARTSRIAALLSPSAALWSRSRIEALAQEVIDEAAPLLNYLAMNFECPIYVHNAGLLRRTRHPHLARLLTLLTARQRAIAGCRIARWLKDYAAAINPRARNQIQIIDEVEIVRCLGGWPACLYLHASEFQHSTRLSFAIAEEYAHRIEMLARLNGRKLVVCDLDNTLWEGVIGEGPVRHFVERQEILKRLKNKSGVVLSIASKNDPANVHFTNGVLGEQDFVASQINWDLKRNSVKSVCKALNLQERHTAFIDDRPDERALVKQAIPEVQVLDATDADAWHRLALWADLVEGASDLDRTALYREQLARDGFMAPHGSARDPAQQAHVVAQLGLQIDVRRARKADIKRVVELINRTNQWNLCGSRTTVAEIGDLVSGRGYVLIGSARDRFGEMGDVCVAVVRREEDGRRAEIPIFVLSCRVFGYGVEIAVLDEIEKCVDLGIDVEHLVGRYVATAQNHMARNMYLDQGYSRQDDGTFLLSRPARVAKVGTTG